MEGFMEPAPERDDAAITAIRWEARVLGVITAGLFLLIFIGESMASHRPSKPIELSAVIGLGPMGVYVVAMFMALKWERAGSLLGAASLGIFFVMMFLGMFHGNVEGGFSLKGVLNPVLLAFWLPFLLYLLCGRLEGRGRKAVHDGVAR
jgi:hypothetical protein